MEAIIINCINNQKTQIFLNYWIRQDNDSSSFSGVKNTINKKVLNWQQVTSYSMTELGTLNIGHIAGYYAK